MLFSHDANTSAGSDAMLPGFDSTCFDWDEQAKRREVCVRNADVTTDEQISSKQLTHEPVLMT
jgi:hypothetical protein